MGFGSEIVFVFVLGFLLLGPKRLQGLLGHVARAKAQLKNATHHLTSQLDAALESQSHQEHMNSHTKTGGGQ